MVSFTCLGALVSGYGSFYKVSVLCWIDVRCDTSY